VEWIGELNASNAGGQDPADADSARDASEQVRSRKEADEVHVLFFAGADHPASFSSPQKIQNKTTI
jgi:hypothetical protein